MVVDNEKITETENINIIKIKSKDAMTEIIDLLDKFLDLYYLLCT